MIVDKAVPGWPYRVTPEGNVYSERHGGRLLTPMRMGRKRKQYSVVALCNKGVEKRFKVHDLVLTLFVGPRPIGHLGLHKDDDTTNNRLENLYWGTSKQNARDTRAHGRAKHQKLTEAQAAQIKARRAAGERGVDLAREFGVSQQTICDIKNGRGWG